MQSPAMLLDDHDLVCQHLGNLSPDQLDEDPVHARLVATSDDERTRYLDDVAWRADLDATSIRWGATSATSAALVEASASW